MLTRPRTGRSQEPGRHVGRLDLHPRVELSFGGGQPDEQEADAEFGVGVAIEQGEDRKVLIQVHMPVGDVDGDEGSGRLMDLVRFAAAREQEQGTFGGVVHLDTLVHERCVPAQEIVS